MDNRVLSISYVMNKNGKQIPYIRLQGNWLERLGFKYGNKVLVEETDGELVLRLIEFEHNQKSAFNFLT